MLAHQGGWDEILLVLGPIVLVGGLLRLAKRRVERAAQHTAQHTAQHVAEPPAQPPTHPHE